MSSTVYEDITTDPLETQRWYHRVFVELFAEILNEDNALQGGLFDTVDLQPTITERDTEPHGVHLHVAFPNHEFHIKYDAGKDAGHFKVWDSNPETTPPRKGLYVPRGVVAYIMSLLWRSELRRNS